MPANVVIPKQIKISSAFLLHVVTTQTNHVTSLLQYQRLLFHFCNNVVDLDITWVQNEERGDM
jgi:hypothetical protein